MKIFAKSNNVFWGPPKCANCNFKARLKAWFKNVLKRKSTSLACAEMHFKKVCQKEFELVLIVWTEKNELKFFLFLFQIHTGELFLIVFSSKANSNWKSFFFSQILANWWLILVWPDMKSIFYSILKKRSILIF